jgi:hypothetical protein
MKKVRIAIGAAALAPAAIALVPGAAHAATRIATCTAAPHHWLRFRWIAPESEGSTCFGYNGGTWYGGVASVSRECGGNNVGWYSGRDLNGEWNQTFVEGTTYRNIPQGPGSLAAVSKVHISSWYGSETCT